MVGLDVICLLGGVHINEKSEANFLSEVTSINAAITVKIKEPDFEVEFNPTEKAWTVTWKWNDDLAPECLINWTSEYTMPKHIREKYNNELQTWISNGWLIPYPEKELGPPRSLISLIAKVQEKKGRCSL